MENYMMLRDILYDAESKKIFDARIEYMRTADTLDFIKKMHDLYKIFRYSELDEFVKNKEIRKLKFVVFGAGYEGEIAVEILKHTKYSDCLYGFCDNNNKLWGTLRSNLPVRSVYELLADKNEFIYILASNRYNNQFLQQLLRLGVPQRNIFISPYGGFLFATRGWQYFDIPEPGEHEVFVDAGAFDGMTSRDFLRWCHGKYDKIHMFEPNINMKDICYTNLKRDDRINYYAKGIWDSNANLSFDNYENASCIREISDNDKEGNHIAVCSIDSELSGENITFIKMDVEGSEMNALRDAKNIIKNLKPKLAICVYHKLDDMVNIMNYLHILNPEYLFCLRHYSACPWETVLYALMDGK